MDDGSKVVVAIISIVAAAMILMIGFSLGESVGENRIKRQAVLEGHAHYEPNQYGDSSFKWNKWNKE